MAAEHVELSFSDVGRGLPVVLIHGFPLSHEIWHAQRALQDEFRVIVPDLRGHGRSPAPEGIYEMSLLAQDLFALLDRLEVRQAVWVGHSMGGYVALAGCRLARERFLGLALVNSQTLADHDEARRGRLALVEKIATGGSHIAAEVMLPKLFSPQLPVDSPLREEARQIIAATPATGIIGALQGLARRTDSTTLLAEVDFPTLILAGSEDQIIPLERSRQLHAQLHKGTLAVIAGAGHMAMRERPEETTRALRDFLRTCGESSS